MSSLSDLVADLKGLVSNSNKEDHEPVAISVKHMFKPTHHPEHTTTNTTATTNTTTSPKSTGMYVAIGIGLCFVLILVWIARVMHKGEDKPQPQLRDNIHVAQPPPAGKEASMPKERRVHFNDSVRSQIYEPQAAPIEISGSGSSSEDGGSSSGDLDDDLGQGLNIAIEGTDVWG
jgi:hypothetical protein